VLRIRDVYYGSEFCPFRIRVFPSRIRIKEFKYFNPKKWLLSSRKYDSGCSSRIPILNFLPIPDPGSRGKKGTGFRIRSTALIQIQYRKTGKYVSKLIPTGPSSFLTWYKIAKMLGEKCQQNLYSNIFGMKERTYTPAVSNPSPPTYVSMLHILLPLQAQRPRAALARGWWVTPMTIRSRASPPSVRLAAGDPGKGSRRSPGCSSILGKHSCYDGAYPHSNFSDSKTKILRTYLGWSTFTVPDSTFHNTGPNFSLYRTLITFRSSPRSAEGASNSGPTMNCDSSWNATQIHNIHY